MYELIGISLALAALLALNALASLVADVVWRAVRPRTSEWKAETRAQFLFALRVFPPALAAAFAFVLVIPAYVLTEPTNTDETVGLKLLLIAAASAAGLLLAVWRIAGTLIATRKLAREWIRRAEPVEVEGISLPAYRIRHEFPVIAVVGVLRPRLFIASQVFDALSASELAAALAHERSHVEARDNFKRAALHASQDALLFAPLGRTLTRSWLSDCELAADESAASESSTAALDLASAIIKISRLIPAGARPLMPSGAHLLGEEEDGLSRRVRNLLRLATPGYRARMLPHRSAKKVAVWVFRLGLCAAFVLVVTHPSFLRVTHAAIEQVVANLR
ncbi:MAG TPA: M56 family metallopeptidase [Pyrinomonadaceae bacterium]|nr:M56 family metallopeptidase [Pyrinomonadaceae bacterium]